MFGFRRFFGRKAPMAQVRKTAMPPYSEHELFMLKVAQDSFVELGQIQPCAFLTESPGRVVSRLGRYLDSSGRAGRAWKKTFEDQGGFEAVLKKRIQDVHIEAVRVCVDEVSKGKSPGVYATLAGMHLDNAKIDRDTYQVNGMSFTQWAREADFRERDGGRVSNRGLALLREQNVVPLAPFLRKRPRIGE